MIRAPLCAVVAQVLVLALVSFACPVHAGDPEPSGAASEGEPTLKVKLGLGGVVVGEWTRIAVEVRVPKEAKAFEGHLQIALEGTLVGGCQAKLSVASGATQRLSFSIPVVSGKAYRVRLVDSAGKVLASSEAEDDAERLKAGGAAILLAKSGLASLDAKERKGHTELARIEPAALPRDVRLLAPQEAVFLPLGEDSAELIRDPAAVRALKAYVERGGRLVLLGRASLPQALVGTPLESLAPVRDPHSASIAQADLISFLGPIEAPSLAVVRTSLAPGARWTQEHGGIGLCAERRFGDGTVVYVAFDPDSRGARTAPKLTPFLDALAHNPRKRVTLWEAEELAKDCFEAREALSPLAFGLLVAALVLHGLILGPLTYVLGKRRRSPWLSLIVPSLISGALGVLMILCAVIARGDRREARAVSVTVQNAPGARGRVDLELGLFVDVPTSYAIELGDRWTPLSRERGALQALQFRQAPPWIQVEEGRLTRIAPVRAAGRTLSRWCLRGSRAPLGLQVEKHPDGTFSLAASQPLEGCFALRLGKDARLQSLGTLDAQGLGWDPAQAPPAALDAPPIEADPFTDEATRLAIVLRLARRLNREYVARVTSDDPSPRTWLLRLVLEEDVADLDLEVEGQKAKVAGLNLTLVPLEAP